MNAAEVDAKLEDAHDKIGGLHHDQRQLAEAAAVAKADYEQAYARAFLSARAAGRTLDEAKAQATLDTAEERRKMLVTEEHAKSAKGAIAVMTTQVDILRTLAVTHRSVF